ncbi:MAG: hypothetical protein ACFCU1_06940 [Sumerlaeia bacterium]
MLALGFYDIISAPVNSCVPILDALADGSVEKEIVYTLDAQGRRVAKVVNGTTEKKWLYNSFLNPSVEFENINGNDTPLAFFVENVMKKVNTGTDDGTYRLIPP